MEAPNGDNGNPAISRLRHRADAAMVAMVRRHLPDSRRSSHSGALDAAHSRRKKGRCGRRSQTEDRPHSRTPELSIGQVICMKRGNRGEIRKLIRGVTRASDHDATPRASRSPLCRSFVALERLGHPADDPTTERPIHYASGASASVGAPSPF
jgi:hypothetical protein